MHVSRGAGGLSRGLVCGLALLSLVAAVGCPSNNAGSFEDLLRQLTGGTVVNPTDTLTIRIINEAGTGVTEMLTLEIDGVIQEPPFGVCSGTQHVCQFVLPACPQSVVAISEQRVDTAGAFQGGRNFNGSDESFNFTAGQFQCGQVITYTFTETTATAYVF